jgi:hypothetical protein
LVTDGKKWKDLVRQARPTVGCSAIGIIIIIIIIIII